MRFSGRGHAGREQEKQEKEILGNSAAARRCGREGGKKRMCKIGMGVEGAVERNIEWAFQVLVLRSNSSAFWMDWSWGGVLPVAGMREGRKRSREKR